MHAREYAAARGAMVMIYPAVQPRSIEGAEAEAAIAALKEIFGDRWPSKG